MGMSGRSWWSAWKPSAVLGRTAVGLLAALAVAACGGSIPKTQYYIVRIPPPPHSGDPKTPYVLGVERLRAPQMLHDDRIMYYESPTELNYYEYQRWSADPPTMLSELAVQYLDSLGVFAEVHLLPIRQPVDYVLRGRVFNFEEVDFEGSGKGRVSLELTLLRTRDRKVVWSARRAVEAPIQQKGLQGVVGAINAASQQLLGEVLPGVAAQVEQDFKASQGQSP